MTRNRKRYTRSLPLSGLIRIGMFGVLATGLGCGFVHVKNQHVAKGDQKRELERGIVKLEKEIDTIKLRIAEVTDRDAIRIRLHVMGSDLVQIDGHRRVIDRAPAERVAMRVGRFEYQN